MPIVRRSEAFVRETLARTELVEAYNARDTWENNQRSHDLAARTGLSAISAGIVRHGKPVTEGTFAFTS